MGSERKEVSSNEGGDRLSADESKTHTYDIKYKQICSALADCSELLRKTLRQSYSRAIDHLILVKMR